jgi:SAM-dependent methyltransferase
MENTGPQIMDLFGITRRRIPPAPWAEGDNIPWNSPEFSGRMLAEHLSQTHDLASRRLETIDRHVAWIHGSVLGGIPSRVLDLACGPGLYTSRLARLGHECEGIDFAPAAVEHARRDAEENGLACFYRLEDLREAALGTGFGLVMMLYGQFNVFRRSEAASILDRAREALVPGGLLLLEPQREETVAEGGMEADSWKSHGGGGLFSERPHLLLTENFWHPDSRSATRRFFVIDAETGAVERHALTNEAYSDDELRDLLAGSGFSDIRMFPSLAGDGAQTENLVVLGRRIGD